MNKIKGANDAQVKRIKSKCLPNKTEKQIRSLIFSQINEYVLTTNDEPLDAWNDLFSVSQALNFSRN